jgi:hypothetical protein
MGLLSYHNASIMITFFVSSFCQDGSVIGDYARALSAQLLLRKSD